MNNSLFLFFIALMFNLSLSAQSIIEGGISNKNGEAIIAALVTMHNESTIAQTQEMVTDNTGYFIMENIPNGKYYLEISTANYETIKIENFQFPRDRDTVMGLMMVEKKKVIQKSSYGFQSNLVKN